MRAFPALRSLTPLALLAFAAVCSADVHYSVALSPDQKKLLVTVEAPVKGAKEITFQMPRWEPGDYDYHDYGKAVQDFAAKDEHGNTLPVTHPDFSTWTVQDAGAKDVIVTYDVEAGVQNDEVSYSGPSTYMYIVDRKTEPCQLTITMPAGWPIATGLNNKNGQSNVFVAPTYDVLADNPVSSGKYYADSYTVDGKKHYIALQGSAEDVAAIDKAKLHRITSFISSMEGNFWGGLPYDHYVWHFFAFKRPDGGWGLEHLSSTQIGLATGFGPNTDEVLAHEFFHAWNVKRIRSKPLGPFNYQEVPQTGALWWLEGVTDYYAHTLLRRYGWTDDKRYFDVIAKEVGSVRSNDQRLQVSPYMSSFRVRDANGGQGNSEGYGISYYDDGWLVGLCLDMAIRAETGNRKSLDDVAHNLFKKYGHGQPGFPEDGIRTELVNVAGPTLGDLYDKIVMQPGELPVEDALAKVGLTLSQVDQPYVKVAFTYSPDEANKALRVNDPDPSTGLKDGDMILGINGKMFADIDMGQAFQLIGALSNPQIGQPVHLTVKRAGVDQPMAIDVNPQSATRKAWTVNPNPDATPAQVALRQSWLGTPKGWTPPAG